MRQERLFEALRAAHESLAGRSDASYEVFSELVKDWEVFPVELDGKTVGAILRNGPEIHACIKPEGFRRWFNKFAKSILNNTIDSHGFATTTVTAGNATGDKFVRRLGFKQIAERGGNWLYRKEEKWE